MTTYLSLLKQFDTHLAKHHRDMIERARTIDTRLVFYAFSASFRAV